MTENYTRDKFVMCNLRLISEGGVFHGKALRSLRKRYDYRKQGKSLKQTYSQDLAAKHQDCESCCKRHSTEIACMH